MAATDFYLKIDGVDGESAAKGVEKWIRLESFSFGVSNSGDGGRGGGGGAGKSDFSDVSVMKLVDKSSPILMLKCAKGDHISKAQLVARKAGGNQEVYFDVTLDNVFVSSVQQSGATGSDVRPSESVSLNFSKIKMVYSEQDDKGTVGKPTEFAYDLKAAASA